MLLVISPAKKLDAEPIALPNDLRVFFCPPILRDKSIQLVEQLKKYSSLQLQNLFKVSENIAQLNFQRFIDFDPNFGKNTYPAIYLFKGDVYASFNADSLDATQIATAQKKISILSGLYGVLNPLDATQKYRLEMGTKLETSNAKNLYEFWGDEISNELNKKITEHGHKYLINLASSEYFKSVKRKQISVPIIDIDFKYERGGQLKTIGTLAKKARGFMARYIVENDISTPQELQKFDVAGYRYIANLSDEGRYVFLQN